LKNNSHQTPILSIYYVAGIDSLLIEGNDIRLPDSASGEPAIHVTANRVYEAFPCRNVRILNNTVSGRGILLNASPAENNVIKGNKAVGTAPQKIKNQAQAVVENNEGFEVDATPWEPRRKK
jgi:hypothetical protein